MTPDPQSPPIDDVVHDAAIAWRVRRQLRPLNDAEEADFRAWLDAAPAHRAAYTEIEEVWDASGELGRHPLYLETREQVIAAVDRRRVGRRAIAAGLAAALIGLGGGGLYLRNAPKPLATQTFHTAVGQRATVTLADGSEVTLNTDSVVRTQAADDRRLVFLDKGQAFFKVAHDRRHPFVVTAAGRTVTALGTAFDVRIDHGGLKVVLVEGKVRVAPAQGPRAATVAPSAPKAAPAVTDMSAGSELVVVTDTDWKLTPADVARETSWLKGQLVFDDQTLGDIVQEMNRYSERKIVLNDHQLADHRLSGNFKPGDVQGFARMLRTGGVASLRERPNGEIEIVPLQ